MEEESEVRRISEQEENKGIEDFREQRSESVGKEIEMKKEDTEEATKIKDKKLEVVRNLLLGAIVMEKILSLYIESSQNIVWGKEAAWDCWKLPGL